MKYHLVHTFMLLGGRQYPIDIPGLYSPSSMRHRPEQPIVQPYADQEGEDDAGSGLLHHGVEEQRVEDEV